MKVIECHGTPREIGRQTGEALREEIQTHLSHYPGPHGAAWEARVTTFVAVMQRWMPEELDEMHGMADGANVLPAAIYNLNFDNYPDDLTMRECCTNLVFSAGPDGPLLGKNNDCNSGEEDQRPKCLRIVRPLNGIPTATFIYAGWVTSGDAMNAEGVAIGHSSVGSVFQQSDQHAPARIWVGYALRHSRTTEEFVRMMAEIPLRGKGYSFVCVDRAGSACSLEAPCPLVQVRRPDSARGICCVNSYLLPQLAEADRRDPAAKRNALVRAAWLNAQLMADAPTDLARMHAILRHHGDPSICRHGGDDMSLTEFSYLAIPRDSRLRYLHGHPCEGTYRDMIL